MAGLFRLYTNSIIEFVYSFFDCKIRMVISTPGTRFPRAVREPPRRTCACVVSLWRVFPQESRTLRSNQPCINHLDRPSFGYKLREVDRQITDCRHSFLRGDIEWWFPLQALAFRGRSGSLLGALAPAWSPLDAYSRRSLVPSVSINFVLSFSTFGKNNELFNHVFADEKEKHGMRCLTLWGLERLWGRLFSITGSNPI